MYFPKSEKPDLEVHVIYDTVYRVSQKRENLGMESRSVVSEECKQGEGFTEKQQCEGILEGNETVLYVFVKTHRIVKV